MSLSFFSKNGHLLPMSQAVIPLSNIEYAYGFGVYENIRVKNGVPFFVEDHIERLLYSAEVIGVEHELHAAQIIKWIQELVAAITNVSSNTFNLKILLIGARETKDAQLFILPLAPLFPNKKLYSKGARVSAVYYERLFPNAKTLNMLPSYIYYSQAKSQGCYDALFIDRSGNILEGSRTNFFAIKNKTIFTASRKLVLEGVTKKYVIKVAREHGFEMKEQNIPLAGLQEFDGAFLTSTSSKIVPICEVSHPSPMSLSRGERELIVPSPRGRGARGEGSSITFTPITPAIKQLMKLFDEFLDTYTAPSP